VVIVLGLLARAGAACHVDLGKLANVHVPRHFVTRLPERQERLPAGTGHLGSPRAVCDCAVRPRFTWPAPGWVCLAADGVRMFTGTVVHNSVGGGPFKCPAP
jgi:hypothetical protein